MSAVNLLIRLEWLAVLAASLIAYGWLGFSWLWFAVLFLVPDLSMLGYLAGPRVGAIAYNLVHTLLAPAIVAAVGSWLQMPILIAAALLLLAHIAMDRLLGYGLKLSSGFQDTHLGKIGRVSP